MGRGAARYDPEVTTLFVFVDGVGAGDREPATNPLARGDFLLSRFADGGGAPLPRGGRAALADACLGVAGRPQSATGQATLLTGENAPAHLGRHLLGFPNAPLRALLQERSLFRALAAAGRRGVFANAYPVAYLRALGHAADGAPEPALAGSRRRARAAATTVAYAAGGGRFRTLEDARRGEGLTHDLTGERARGLGVSLPRRAPEEAAEILLRVAAGHDLALFEFFETDEAGHARSMERALDALGRLDAFLRALVDGLGPEDALVVTSDHGNLEDLSLRNHTLAPVPVLGFGRAAAEVEQVRDLTGVAPLLLRLAGADAPAGGQPRRTTLATSQSRSP
ncbi:metalloenzyme domain protein [Anaeromyxobacter sp. K]|uniref:alkaline phosphatase family protein n=1 Tax=Anaeromyxobacter sp. (strain K) TaxID=447217 RepID=UPI00015F8D34|nr:alkaline phosphatase family protein [Anaeromyxobacter sp. K]ACG72612.1 metalloenzyme domain protein [Anaeromyxobacter sp. K]